MVPTAMTNGRLLWIDDEIDMLKAHVFFLERKGYEVITATNGTDALECCRNENFDLILLDENMPGLSGLETLSKIKELTPETPVVMVTKSEEENIMDLAIGSKIADYLIKPVNPNQIILSLKKNIHRKEIIEEVTKTNYQQEFNKIGMQINDSLSVEDWMEVYRKLVYWELELSETQGAMDELLRMQKVEANRTFAKFIKRNYEKWMQGEEKRPLMSHDIFRERIMPVLDKKEKVFFLVFDNFRYDQWRVLARELSDIFSFDEELYFSILPTSTQYARNALFSGLMPLKIKQLYPQFWTDEEEEEGKNLFENELLGAQIQRFRRKYSYSYNKFNYSQKSEALFSQLHRLEQNDLNVLVINFIDILSHTRTEQQMVRELTGNDAAFRSITLSWFRHSGIRNLFTFLSESGYKVLLTTDHGSIRVDNAIKVIGDRNTNTNLRYKLGKNLNYSAKDVFEMRKPTLSFLPSPNLSTSYIFAQGNQFFAYPNNYNYYVSYYRDTFQHGGISLEEMLIPFITLSGRQR